MSMTEEDVRHEMYIKDMIDGYNETLTELANSKDVVQRPVVAKTLAF